MNGHEWLTSLKQYEGADNKKSLFLYLWDEKSGELVNFSALKKLG